MSPIDEQGRQMLEELAVETRRLRQELRRSKQTVRRFVVTFLLAVVIAITLHDEHVAHCYPPRSERAERLCNISFPLHNHPRAKE